MAVYVGGLVCMEPKTANHIKGHNVLKRTEAQQEKPTSPRDDNNCTQLVKVTVGVMHDYESVPDY